MELQERANEVRRQRKRLGHICGTRPLPESLRQEALECYRALRAEGVSAGRAAARLGLSTLTLGRWSTQSRTLFAPVVVDAEPAVATAVACGLVVHGPHGLRVEGLDVAGLAELLRRLA